ncbi:hypothetical protein NEMIN01_1407 [Nematocida minor]|uniref:uncharacterized protein n=1 Tax=Nematocida minor TaxID=1912983 RepID=UPI002220339D|nr:uncharacterized protein NEMIN01_1407 [Nematocida minor]KAI5191199.1 hypothetical protein NEMIN01_1407 [Nematocida minor]
MLLFKIALVFFCFVCAFCKGAVEIVHSKINGSQFVIEKPRDAESYISTATFIYQERDHPDSELKGLVGSVIFVFDRIIRFEYEIGCNSKPIGLAIEIKKRNKERGVIKCQMSMKSENEGSFIFVKEIETRDFLGADTEQRAFAIFSVRSKA